MRKLAVSDNRRFLVYEDGAPFFYLGDTAWELFHRLDREETEFYLQDRAAKRFTVIQAVVLAEYEGLTAPNAYGHLPLIDNDPARPSEAYFAHVDAVVARAEALGLIVGMLPTWGDKWNRKWGLGPEIFTPENAEAYGRWLGARYAESPIIWILGGDRPIEAEIHREIIRAMAQGLREGDGGNSPDKLPPDGRPFLRRVVARGGVARLQHAPVGAQPQQGQLHDDRRGLRPHTRKALYGRRACLRGSSIGFRPGQRIPGRLRRAQGALLGALRGGEWPHLRLSRHLADVGGGAEAGDLHPDAVAESPAPRGLPAGAVRSGTVGEPPIPHADAGSVADRLGSRYRDAPRSRRHATRTGAMRCSTCPHASRSPWI